MREIKFRAWDIENEIMYGCITDIHWEISGKAVRCSWCTSEIDCGFLHNTGHCVGGKDNFILEQYTGLKDKNGVKIYEGDIVEHEADTAIRGEVRFWEGAFVVGKSMTDYALVKYSCPKYVRIIGSIHNNPQESKT